MKAAACGRKFNKNFTFLSGRNQLLCFHIYIYIYIYEIKYKTNVLTQSFMPEFADNLRTTKVLLTEVNV